MCVRGLWSTDLFGIMSRMHLTWCGHLT